MDETNIGQKMKEACEKCSIAFQQLADSLNKLQENKRQAPTGSKYHK